jgi:hypothetical protein|tara:strand:+ start:107 stop:307 length:201 start_codon:yes stop_codon:yes gene_type:complete
LEVQLILLKVVEVVVGPTVILNPLLRTLENQEDQEEVVVLVDLDLLEQLVVEIIPLQLPLKEVMEE